MISFLVKSTITVIIFLFIVRAVDGQATLRAFASARPDLLAAAIGLQFISTMLAATRWKLMMRALQHEPGGGFFLKSYFKAVFFNQALPTSVGGDVVRIIDLKATGYSRKESIYAVLIDRIIGVSGLLLLNLLALAIGAERFPETLTTAIAAVVLILITGLVALVFARQWTVLANIKILKYVHDISTRLRIIFVSWKISGQLFLICLLVHLFAIGALYTLGHSVGLRYDFLIYLVLVPPVFLTMILPVSLAGWGVREGSMVALFLFVNADKATSLVVSLLYGLTLLVTSLPGAYFYLTSSEKKDYRKQRR